MKNGITHAPTLLKESFLSNYFFADVMFSRFLATDGARIIFDRYADISGVKDEKWLNTMWDIISSDLFTKADTSSSFNTLLRLSCLFPDRFSENEQYILSLKSSAMQIKETILPSGDNITLDTTKSTIESKAQGGDTDCLALLAFLKYHGFFFAKDQESALKHIKTGACWNHFFCLLMGAQYDPNPHFYHEVIVAILSAPSQLETLNYLREGLNISADTKPYKPSVELEKAFHRGAFQRYKLCPDILKMISSSVLTEQTKCSIIKSANGKDMAHPDIPLNISKASELSYDLSKFRLFSESRSSECDKIIANLSVSDIRASSVYKPLLIVCQDKAAFDLYHIAISDCFKDNPFTILNLIVQSFAQLEKVYEKSTAAIIMDNLNMHIFFGSCNYETKKSFSQECGMHTVISPISALDGATRTVEHYEKELVPLIPVSRLSEISDGECIITQMRGDVLWSKIERSYICPEYANGESTFIHRFSPIAFLDKRYAYDISFLTKSKGKAKMNLFDF